MTIKDWIWGFQSSKGVAWSNTVIQLRSCLLRQRDFVKLMRCCLLRVSLDVPHFLFGAKKSVINLQTYVVGMIYHHKNSTIEWAWFAMSCFLYPASSFYQTSSYRGSATGANPPVMRTQTVWQAYEDYSTVSGYPFYYLVLFPSFTVQYVIVRRETVTGRGVRVSPGLQRPSSGEQFYRFPFWKPYLYNKSQNFEAYIINNLGLLQPPLTRPTFVRESYLLCNLLRPTCTTASISEGSKHIELQ